MIWNIQIDFITAYIFINKRKEKKQESNMYIDNNTRIYPDPLFNRW